MIEVQMVFAATDSATTLHSRLPGVLSRRRRLIRCKDGVLRPYPLFRFHRGLEFV